MKYIDPHIHGTHQSPMTTISTWLAQAGGGVTEPAFWAGYDRSSASSFADYFRHLTDIEPQRAARYGIDHYSWLCINAKEAEDVALSREVIKLIPPLLSHPRVLGVGEIGLNKNTRNEITIFEEQVDLAAMHDQLILIHTPHLADNKHKGTSIIVDALQRTTKESKPGWRADRPLRRVHHPHRQRQRLLGPAPTIHPVSKVTPAALDILEQFA
jgi:predicted metal-dependent TIM-barrel fold hydrolase